jgi:hypothetical protein
MPRVTRHSGQYHFVVRAGSCSRPTHSQWNHSLSHCSRVSELFIIFETAITYIIVVTTDHVSKADTIATAVSRFVRINDISFVINLNEILSSTSFTAILLFLLRAAFFRVAALRLPILTAAEPSEPAVTTPGAGRLARLLGWRGSGAGVLRAVLARRGRSMVAVAVGVGIAGSRLAALLREDVGRFAGRGSGAGVGVGAPDVRRGRVLTIGSGLLISFFAPFLSLVGGNIGVEDFFGDGSKIGTAKFSAAASVGVWTEAGSDSTDGAVSRGARGVACFVAMG